jgi:hypothetical protein
MEGDASVYPYYRFGKFRHFLSLWHSAVLEWLVFCWRRRRRSRNANCPAEKVQKFIFINGIFFIIFVGVVVHFLEKINSFAYVNSSYIFSYGFDAVN